MHPGILMCRTPTVARRTYLPCILTVLSWLVSQGAVAQPAIEITDLVVNWPSIEVYFTAECDSSPVWDANVEHFTLKENGEEIEDLTLWCPDPAQTAISAALVLDISASMDPKHRSSAEAAFRRFISGMDGAKDEAELLQFNESVQVRQAMTTDTALLQAALADVAYDGDAFLWDGIYAGITELIINSVNPARAVIVLTAGVDAGSVRTLADVQTLAARNRIPVHVVTFGSLADTAALAALAGYTGGRHLHSVQGDGATEALLRILGDMHDVLLGNPTCVISYPRTRADGTQRNVELTFKDYCDSSVTAQTIYRTPFIPESMLDIGCSDTLHLRYDTQTGLYNPNPFSVTVPYRNLSTMSLSNLQGMVTPVTADIILAPGSPPLQLHPGGRLPPWQEGDTVTSFTWEFTFAGITPCIDRMFPVVFLVSGTDTSLTPVVVTCTTIVMIEGASPELGAFRLAVEGPTEFCYGDSLTLDAGPEAVFYFWSNGASTRRITVRESGSYFCEALTTGCSRGFSDTIAVTVFPAAFKPAVMRDRDVLRSTEAPYYQWLRNGEDIPGATQRTYILTETGTYQVRATNEHGCSELSDPYEVTVLSVDVNAVSGFRLDVYPRPARDAVTVMLRGANAGAATIMLYDQLGRRVLRREMELHHGRAFVQINVGALNRGIYVLEAHTNAQRSAQLLLLE